MKPRSRRCTRARWADFACHHVTPSAWLWRGSRGGVQEEEDEEEEEEEEEEENEEEEQGDEEGESVLPARRREG